MIQKQAIFFISWSLFLLVLPAALPAAGQEARSEELMNLGKRHYSQQDYEEALQNFRNITLDSSIEAYHGEAFLWLAKTYLALDDLRNAQGNLEFFLNQYPEHPSVSHGFYLKGRLLYRQGEMEKALEVFQHFLEGFPQSPYRANGIYWAADSLYQLGHLKKARPLYRKVVEDYQASHKVEAARYRLSLIDLKYREQELLTLIKWSHEEALKALDEFQARERSYEEAITSYQKKIADLTDQDIEEKLSRLQDDVRIKEEQIAALRREKEQQEERVEMLQNQLEAARKERSAETGDGETEGVSSGEPSDLSTRDITMKEQLLDLKARALTLQMDLMEVRAQMKGGDA